jgi:hypothetical protein
MEVCGLEEKACERPGASDALSGQSDPPGSILQPMLHEV